MNFQLSLTLSQLLKLAIGQQFKQTILKAYVQANSIIVLNQNSGNQISVLPESFYFSVFLQKQPCPMLHSFPEVSTVNAPATIGLPAHSIQFILNPFALEHHPVCIFHFALPMHEILLEHALIEGTVTPFEETESFLQAIRIFANKSRAVASLLFPFPILEPVLPLALIDSILARIEAPPMEIIVLELALVEILIGEGEPSCSLHPLRSEISNVDCAIAPLYHFRFGLICWHRDFGGIPLARRRAGFEQKMVDGVEHYLLINLLQRLDLLDQLKKIYNLSSAPNKPRSVIIEFQTMLIPRNLVCIFALFLLYLFGANCLSQACIGLTSKLGTSTGFSTEQILKELEDRKCLTQIVPTYKWSQNMSHIQVKIQFSITAQTAPCEKVLFENRTIHHNAFGIRLLCLHDKYLIDYHLSVQTYKSLDFEFADWKRGQQNSIVLECLKSPAPYFWPILHSRTTRPARTPKIWWQMLSKYGPELRKVIDLLQIGDEDHEVSKKVKQRRKKPVEDKKTSHFFCLQSSPQYLGSWL